MQCVFTLQLVTLSLHSSMSEQFKPLPRNPGLQTQYVEFELLRQLALTWQLEFLEHSIASGYVLEVTLLSNVVFPVKFFTLV